MTVSASTTISKALNQIARRGWFSSWPSEADGESLLFAAFHVHPDDADSVFERLSYATQTYDGKTRWVVLRAKQNRFVLFPEELEQFNDVGNVGRAAVSLRKAMPELEYQAATDIRELSAHLLAVFAGPSGDAD